MVPHFKFFHQKDALLGSLGRPNLNPHGINQIVSDLRLSSCRSTSSSDVSLGLRRRRRLHRKWSEGWMISGWHRSQRKFGTPCLMGGGCKRYNHIRVGGEFRDSYIFKSKLIKMTHDALSDNGSLAALLHYGHLMMEIVKTGAKKYLFRVNWSKNGWKAFLKSATTVVQITLARVTPWSFARSLFGSLDYVSKGNYRSFTLGALNFNPDWHL